MEQMWERIRYHRVNTQCSMLPCLQLWLCWEDHASKAGKSTNSAFDNGSCTEESLFTGRRQYMVLDYTRWLRKQLIKGNIKFLLLFSKYMLVSSHVGSAIGKEWGVSMQHRAKQPHKYRGTRILNFAALVGLPDHHGQWSDCNSLFWVTKCLHRLYTKLKTDDTK